MYKVSTHVTHKLGILISLLLPALLIVNVEQISADSVNPGLYSIDSKPFGIPYTEWTAIWWQWLLKFPNTQLPFEDPTGEKCGLMQNGSVWFLAGSAGPEVRNCTIPSDKAILIPIINTECSYAEDDSLKNKEDLTKCAIDGQKNIEITEASVDNRSIIHPEKYRITTGIFNVTFSDSPMVPVSSNVSQAVSDGFYLFLEPLSVGKHDLKVKANQLSDNPEEIGSTALVDATYHLTIK